MSQKILRENIAKIETAIKNFDLNVEVKKVERTAQKCLKEINDSQKTFIGLKTKDSHTPDFYSNAIEKLSEAEDIEAGIQWTIDKNNNTIIRDGRNGIGLKESAYSELATAFNAARAADRMIRIKDKQIRTDDEESLSPDDKTRIEQIKAKILQVKDSIQGNPSQKIDLKSVNEFLVTVLRQDPRYQDLNDEKLYKQLNTTKDIAGLEDKKYNICTIFTQFDSENEEHIVFESETIIPPLKADYNDIKNDIIDGQKSEFNKGIVDAYWDALAAQETIPTQNLKTLPGLRNAYIKSVGEIEVNDGKKTIKTFGTMMHTGTVASEVKTKTSNQIADMNVLHMSEMGKALSDKSDKGIVITTLNTPVMFGGIEQKAYDQLDAAVKKIGKSSNIKRGLTAMNNMRFLASSKLSAYRETLAELGVQLIRIDKYKIVGEYLQGKRSEAEARSSIAQLDHKTKNILEKAISTKAAVEPTVVGAIWRTLKQIPLLGQVMSFAVKPFKMLWDSVAGPKMSNAQKRTAGIAALTAMINSGGLGGDIKMPVFSVHCKSGKDRTGAIGIDFTRRLIEATFGHKDQNLEKQINAGHVGKMAEFGGTPGCIGMKGHAGLSGEMYTKELLEKVGLKTAGNNKISQRKTSRFSIIPNEIVPGIDKTTIPEVNKITTQKQNPEILPETLVAAQVILEDSSISTSSSFISDGIESKVEKELNRRNSSTNVVGGPS